MGESSGGVLAAGVGVSAVRVSWFRFWFLGRGFDSRAASGDGFFGFCCAVHSTSGVLLFSSKAIDGDMPNGQCEWTEQQFGRLGALSARALRAKTATQMSTFSSLSTSDEAKRAAASYFERPGLASTRRVSAPSAGSATGYAALRQARTF